jgi:magnesium-transporting ATPase (P-type)
MGLSTDKKETVDGKKEAEMVPLSASQASAQPRQFKVTFDTMQVTSSKPFATNRVKSTKYTVWSFLPRALLNQLMNVVNLFFIVNGILQYIPAISTNSPLASLVPVGWVMLMGMLFELIEDVKRHNQDKKDNTIKVEKVSASGGKIDSKHLNAAELAVGNVIKLKDNQMVPADCIVLSAVDSNGLCYISTESLDGERNLKPKLAP